MKVLGVEVPEETIADALKSFPPERAFTLSDLRGALSKRGVPYASGVADRAADRALQKARRAGTHIFAGGKWRQKEVKAE